MQSNIESKNIIAGPDYGQLVKLNTNGAIIEAFIPAIHYQE